MSGRVETSPSGRLIAKGVCQLKANVRGAKQNLRSMCDCFPWQ